jgi:hypothetical protein
MTSTTRGHGGAEDRERAGESGQARRGRRRAVEVMHLPLSSATDLIRGRLTTVDRQRFWRTEPNRAGPGQNVATDQ